MSHSKPDPVWNKLNVDSEGRLEASALGIRLEASKITEKESHIAALSGRGYSNGRIAELFHIDVRTVDNESSRVRRKLGMSRKEKFRIRQKKKNSDSPIL